MNETRTALVPADVKRLESHGHTVYVESSETRCFADIEYTFVIKQPWFLQESDTIIVGLKELENLDKLKKHIHVYFSHSFKEQEGSKEILNVFRKSESLLYDLEYFQKDGVRLLSFGYYAGLVGGILGLTQNSLRKEGRDLSYLKPWLSLEAMYASCTVIKSSIAVIGNGRCSRGVQHILRTFGLSYTLIGRDSIVDLSLYTIVFNCILLDITYTQQWITSTTLPSNPLLLVDISCDYTRKNNPIAIYNKGTTWEKPVYHYNDTISIIAIDNLPSLLPREASTEFSRMLTDLLLRYGDSTWSDTLAMFRSANLRLA
jgi:saccharopine dehydrogenase (NAD+, L-lysine-forming)